MCGISLEAHSRHVRYRLPDPVLITDEQENASGAWLSHADPIDAVMMQIPRVAPFLRALMPVHLIGGHIITFGIWVTVHPADLQRAYSLWWEPEYQNLRLHGWLANSIKPWGLLNSPVNLAVLDPDHTPYCVSSRNPTLSAVLEQEWPHQAVLGALPEELL